MAARGLWATQLGNVKTVQRKELTGGLSIKCYIRWKLPPLISVSFSKFWLHLNPALSAFRPQPGLALLWAAYLGWMPHDFSWPQYYVCLVLKSRDTYSINNCHVWTEIQKPSKLRNILIDSYWRIGTKHEWWLPWNNFALYIINIFLGF